MISVYRCLLCVALIIVPLSAEAATQTQWTVTQLTDNDFEDIDPVVNDSLVAWRGWKDDNWEVYAYNGQTVRRLTNNSLDEQNLFASDKYIAWNWRDASHGDNIFLYDGKTVKQITDSYKSQTKPKVYGERMVWSESFNLVLYNIADDTSSQLTIEGWEACLHGDSVSFTSHEGYHEIYYYDIVHDEYHQITDNDLSDYSSKINDDYITYYHWDSNDREVMLYNRATLQTTQITDNSVNEENLLLSGHYLVWTTDTGSNFQNTLHLYNASTGITQIIADNIPNVNSVVSIDGNMVVYSGYDGNDTEIYIYEIDKDTTTQLTDNDSFDTSPMVRGKRIVWEHTDLTTQPKPDKEIMLATPASEGMFYILNAKDGKTVVIYL